MGVAIELAGLVQLQEWEAKLANQSATVKRIGLIRAVRAMNSVMLKAAVKATETANIPRTKTVNFGRIRQVGLDSLGASFRKGYNDSSRVARVGFGVGRRKKTRRFFYETGKVLDKGGRLRTVATKRFRVTRSTYRVHGKMSRVVGRVFGKNAGKSWKVKRKRTTARRLKGVGIGKANIHWAVLGTEPRFTKTPRRFTGAMQPFLDGILGRVKDRYAAAALAAGEKQIMAVLMEAQAKKGAQAIKQALRASL